MVTHVGSTKCDPSELVFPSMASIIMMDDSFNLYDRYEVITTPTDIVMVMEYAGGELFDYISNKIRVSYLECIYIYI
jgi:hypothetical protein